MVKKFGIILAVATIFFLLVCVSILVFISREAKKDTKVKSQVILVLGGHVIAATSCVGPICKQKGFVMKPHYNPCVVARVDHAVSLYKDGYAPKIIMSGGTDDETHANEAETMKKMAITSGVPEKDILLENKSTSTYENFAFSQKVLMQNKLHSVIIVTEPYHMARAELVASKLKYIYSLSPTRTSPCWNDMHFSANWNFVKKEVVAIIGYKLLGKI